TADAAGLDFDHRLHVVDRDHEDLQRILVGLLLDLFEGTVDDALGNGLLAGFHHDVHELREVDRSELRVGQDLALGYFAATWHGISFQCFSWRQAACPTARMATVSTGTIHLLGGTFQIAPPQTCSETGLGFFTSRLPAAPAGLSAESSGLRPSSDASRRTSNATACDP